MKNPIHKVPGGYQWGRHGKIYPHREDAVKQAQAIYASGWIEKNPITPRICPHCGAEISTPGSTVLLSCPKCGKDIDKPSDWRKGFPVGGKRNPTMFYISPSAKKKINDKLYSITKGYHEKIPLDKIFDILYSNNIIPLQEDNTEFSGFLVGIKADNVLFTLAPKESEINKVYRPFKNVALHMSWYQMSSGRYEVIAYLG